MRVFRNNSEVLTVQADEQGRFTATVELVPDSNAFFVRAEDASGNRSLDSSMQGPSWSLPRVAVQLQPPVVNGTDVSLTFTVSALNGGYPGDLKELELRRRQDGAPPVVKVLGTSERAYIDSGLRSGTYTYTLVPKSILDVPGTPSNAVSAMVTATLPVPEPPTSVAVEVLPQGQALLVKWTHPGSPAGFRVERAETTAGPFVALRGGQTLSGRSVVDAELVNGKTYAYRVLAVNVVGDPSAPSPVALGVPADTQAPVAPLLTTPTIPGTPYVASSASIPVGGLAEPLSRVSVFRNGQLVGSATAGDALKAVVGSPLPLAQAPLLGTPALAADGRKLAYTSGDGSRLVVEDLDARKVLQQSSGAGLTFSNPIFSPDGRRIAVEARTVADGKTFIHLVDVATGDRQPLLGENVTPAGQQYAPAWSPDSSKLAYESVNEAGVRSLAVADVAVHTESVLPLKDGEIGAQAPRWLAGGQQLLAILKKPDGSSTLTRIDRESGARTPLFKALMIFPPYALSTDWGMAALVALNPGGPPAQYLVDTMAGTVTQLAQTSNVTDKLPVFGPDERSVLYVKEGGLFRYDLGKASAAQLMPSFPGSLLIPSASGRVLVQSGGSLSDLGLGASFSLPGVALVSGENLLTATATDGANLRSVLSQAMVVRYTGLMADLAVSAVLQPTTPVSNEPANVLVTVTNVGTAATLSAPAVAVTVVGADGSLRPAPLARSRQALAAGASALLAVSADVQGLLGPGQQLKVLVDPSRELIESSRTNNEQVLPFSVAASRDTGLVLTTTRSRYTQGEVATVLATVANRSSALLEGATYELSVTNGQGKAVFGKTVAVPLLAPGSRHDAAFVVPAEALAAGQYMAQGTVKLDREKLAEGLARFSVDSRSVLSGALLVKSATGEPPAQRAGTSARVSFQVSNSGSAAEPGLGLRLVVSRTDTLQVVATQALPAQPLAAGQVRQGEHLFPTEGWEHGPYAVSLVAVTAAGEDRLLASTALNVLDGAAPQACRCSTSPRACLCRARCCCACAPWIPRRAWPPWWRGWTRARKSR